MDPWQLVIGFAAGAAAGAAFFAALWWTARRLPSARKPGLLALGSFVARLTVVLGVFYLLSRYGRWEPMVAALAGFVAARLVAVRRVRPAAQDK